jgi:ABC-2 type transport system permease protein
MLETARYETARRRRETAVLTVAISLYSAFVVWYFSALDGVEYEELVSEAPAALRDAFGIEALSTVEGFLSAQIFNFVWLLGLGLYFAYTGGGLIAGDIESERMELLLSFPLSRSRLLVEKFASLLLPIVVVNVVTAGVLYALVTAIGESVDATDLFFVHLFSVPYLLVCAGIGVALSVAVDRAAVAERAAVGVVFVLFLVESVVGTSTDFGVLRYLSPTNYYQPTEILVDGSYGITGSGVLLGAFLCLLAVCLVLFRQRDI